MLKRLRSLFCGCTSGFELEESDREINITEPPPRQPPSQLSFIFEPTPITELDESPGMTKRKFNNSSPFEDNSEEQSGKKINLYQPPFHSQNYFKSLLKAHATRSKSNEQETSLRPFKATNIFDQSTPSTIASSQSHPINLYRSDTKLSPAWFQHSHEQLLSLHTKNSPKPQQPITPQCGTFPSGQIGDQQSSHRSTKSRCMPSNVQSNYNIV